jgi:membrane protein required for colicin V production
VQFAMLGWVNRLGGILLYAALYILIISIIIFYIDQVHLIKSETKESSISYSYIQPWGTIVIESLGKFIPFFQGMFEDLKDFFGNVSTHVHSAK